ncbi:hypothetical protein CC1G_05546 [Coprinopsis cinerea okayama7|uniref:Uncharacterized protein n=1 Tax=Coprinopsis cinerea (strain Okayama-7 / 130 / ATCC MYA-4618 / FGSC 9003) TaxID=240176 RepID=A8P1C2_COPC7|nr:hypothetical protein CC1G_05546 [Coprinopsis cinerea okayama7\|eukprot:XP_001838065.2 hypothetical protein CC1G_05546 [Coprinopsis cinerea okayama7\
MSGDQVDDDQIPPINRLPTELLGSIFIATLPVNGKPVISTTSVPLVLADVCRQWREVAKATSQLWEETEFHLCDTKLRHWFPREQQHPHWHRFEYIPEARRIVVEKAVAFTRWMDYAGPTSLSFGLFFYHDVLDDILFRMLASAFSIDNVAKIRAYKPAPMSCRFKRYVHRITPAWFTSLTRLTFRWDDLYTCVLDGDHDVVGYYQPSRNDLIP